MPHPSQVDDRLQAHLRSWLGAWPPVRPVHVVGSDRRTEPGWNGVVRALNGVSTSDGTVVSVPPASVARVAAAVEEHDGADVASARTADASGFADVGWRIFGLFGGDPGTP